MKPYNYIKKPTSERVKEEDIDIRNKLGIISKRPDCLKTPKFHKNKKYQDVVIKNWKMYGYFIEPTENEIKEEIIKEELIESDEYEYIDLEEYIEDDDETEG